tara:strand:- start:903 stop:1523 length:621 start_codon:yes stop_codon:yes gene_type:complete
MAQHDYNIANQSAPNARADINNVLAAIVSQNSGTSEPSTTYANQIWYDSSANILKMRNEADSAWIDLTTLNQTAGTASAAVDIASQAEAEAGTNTVKTMTPERVKQAITYNDTAAGHLAVGTYAYLLNNSGSAITGGSTVAGSSLQYGVESTGTYSQINNATIAGTAASGTWRLMGVNCEEATSVTDPESSDVTTTWRCGLFFRIS